MSNIALVTGASVGIGAATARALDNLGYSLVLMARRKDKLDELAENLKGSPVNIACDVTDKQQVVDALKQIPVVDVLVNNAGLALGLETADKTNWDHWQTMINTNCTALAYLTRQLLPGMVERNKGHIINMGSIAGTYAYPGGNCYGATKAFVEQFSMGLRSDLLGTAIKVTNLEPGLIGGTEFSNIRFDGDDAKADATYQDCQPMTAQDVANTVAWLVQQPAHLNINKIEMMPVCQAPAGLLINRG